MPIAIGNVTSSMRRDVAPTRSATRRITPPTTRATATSPICRNESSMTSLNTNPTKAAGIVEATRSHASFRSSSPWNERSRAAANPAGTSRTQSARK
jgi:hypothetical protein